MLSRRGFRPKALIDAAFHLGGKIEQMNSI
jgi:hypothetical protein